MKVLVVESEAALREAIEQAVRAQSHEVSALATGGAALESLAYGTPDVLVVGLELSDMDGERVVQSAAAFPLPPRIVLLGRDIERLDRASAAADAVFRLPLDLPYFMSLMEFYQRRTPPRG